jgi:hypothetical protein
MALGSIFFSARTTLLNPLTLRSFSFRLQGTHPSLASSHEVQSRPFQSYVLSASPPGPEASYSLRVHFPWRERIFTSLQPSTLRPFIAGAQLPVLLLRHVHEPMYLRETWLETDVSVFFVQMGYAHLLTCKCLTGWLYYCFAKSDIASKAI